jgi:hypothetical protein
MKIDEYLLMAVASTAYIVARNSHDIVPGTAVEFSDGR